MTSCGPNIHHFQCQRRPSRRGLVPELGPNPAVPARRRNPKPQIGQKRQAHTPEMTAANFHRPSTRTADAAQHKRHESKKITQDLSRGTTWAAQPPPPLDSYPPAEFFFSKCRTNKNTPGLVNIDKNAVERVRCLVS